MAASSVPVARTFLRRRYASACRQLMHFGAPLCASRAAAGIEVGLQNSALTRTQRRWALPAHICGSGFPLDDMRRHSGRARRAKGCQRPRATRRYHTCSALQRYGRFGAMRLIIAELPLRAPLFVQATRTPHIAAGRGCCMPRAPARPVACLCR